MRRLCTSRAVGLAACLLLATACTADDGTEPIDQTQDDETDGAAAAPDDAEAPDDAADEPATETEVSVVDNAFEPAEVEVTVAATVTWTHDGDLTHDVTAEDGTFASNSLQAGESFEHTFDEPGTFAYLCTIHGATMSGTVIVEG
jgi:plastocyanin